MNENVIEFYIKNFSFKTPETIDLSCIPMMTRRRLSTVEKLAISAMYDCFENENVNVVFASKYGEIERSFRLLEQYTNDNEVSPADFGFSVHNSTASIFSILKKIKLSYNAISSGDNSLEYGILEGILQLDNKNDSLICYSENDDKNYAVALLISKNPLKNSDKIKYTSAFSENENEPDFLSFLTGKTNKINCKFYSLERFKQ